MFPDKLPDLIDYLATGLSGVMRFQGYCDKPYSVAQHCCLVDDLSHDRTPKHRLRLLLHDAAECVIGDIPSPWKPVLPDFVKLEEYVNLELQFRIEQLTGLREIVPGDYKEGAGQVAAVKNLDFNAMLLEIDRLFGPAALVEQFGFADHVVAQIPATRTAEVGRHFQQALKDGDYYIWSRKSSKDYYANRLTALFSELTPK